MFKIIITESIYNKIIADEEKEILEQHSNLYLMLKKYDVKKLSIKETHALLNNPVRVLDNPSAVYILDIPADKAKEIQDSYGVMCISSEKLDYSSLIDVNDTFVTHENHKLLKGWDTILDSVENLPSNSLMIIDRYLFKPDNADEDGFENVQVILDQLLPPHFESGEYHVIIVFNEEKSAYSFTNIVKTLEDLRQQINRDYPVKMEILGFFTNTVMHRKLHNRVIISNYYIVEAAHKLAAFKNDVATARQTIIPFALFTESSLTGASSAPLRAIKQNIKALQDFSKYVAWRNPNYAKYHYAINGEQKERCRGLYNRLLE